MEFIIDIFIGDRFRIFITLVALMMGVYVYFRYRKMKKWSKKFTKELIKTHKDKNDLQETLNSVNDWIKNKGKAPVVLKDSWAHYYNDTKNSEDGSVLDPYEYFKEDDFVHKYGKRKFVESIPAILVSLGILGTFFGLVRGMQGIETGGNSEDMMQGVEQLLGGMEVAFLSSIAGIILSILFQLFDRTRFYNMLTDSIDRIRKAMDETVPIKTEGDLLNDLVHTQKEQMDDLKSFFSEVMIPQLTSGISDSLSKSVTETLNPHLEKSNQIMEEVVKNSAEQQSERMGEMVDSFIASLHEVNGDHMKHLGEALNKTIEWQEKVHTEMGALVDEMKDVAEKQTEMAKNTTELSAQMNEYTETLSEYQTGMVDVTSELTRITEKNTHLLSEMGDLSESITKQQRSAEERIESQLKQMEHVVNALTDQGSTLTDLQSQTTATVRSLEHSASTLNDHTRVTTDLNDSLIAQHEKSNEWSAKTQSLLEDLVENSEINETMQEKMSDLFDRISAEREKLDNTKEEHTKLVMESVEELKEFWQENQFLLSDNKNKFTELNDSLANSMDNFAEHMQVGIQRTFEQFDAQLKEAVNYLDRGVQSIGSVVESMENDIDSVNGQITRFNQSISQLAATKQ